MPLVTCPLCGSGVKVPGLKANVPLLCRKCHSPFHLNRTGDPVLGKPPDVEQDVEELKQLVREKLSRIPVGKIVSAFAFLLIAGLLVSYLLRPNDSLKTTAETAAQAFAGNDLPTLESMAVSGTAEDVARWYGELHPILKQTRERWNGQTEAVDVGIALEDAASHRGATAFSVHPGRIGARDVSITAPGEFTASASGSFDSMMAWTLNGSGHWQIDGRGTYASLHPPGSASSGSAQTSVSTARK